MRKLYQIQSSHSYVCVCVYKRGGEEDRKNRKEERREKKSAFKMLL